MEPLRAVTQEILRRVNAEIMEHASLVAETLLTGLWKSLFRVERATEFSEPDVFNLDDDPALILERRMSPLHWRYLPLFVTNQEILAKRFQQYLEYEFIFVADLTPSMGYRWRDVYLGLPGGSENSDYLWPHESTDLGNFSSTKLFILKYLLYAFLFSAIRFGFRCRATFFSLNDVVSFTGIGADFPFQALRYVDEHFSNSEDPNIWEAAGHFSSPYERVLLELLEHRSESVVLFASDFLDLVHGRASEDQIDPYLAELKYHHRFAVVQINDEHEVNTRYNKDELPTSTRWAFQRNLEAPDEGGIGQQRYYRPLARNTDFVERCRHYLGQDERLDGKLARLAASRGITVQKFVYGSKGARENLIEERLQEIGRWLE